MKRKILMTFGLLAGIAVGARAQQTEVTAREGTLELPTYVLNAAETAPIFERDWSYQRARRSVYPYPLDDNMTRNRKTVSYKALYLENEYVELCVLPEIGGRLFYAIDKTNGYDIFYHQHVVKPANVGMTGAWISGGVEWNVFHHHRATSNIPCDYRIVENEDGSKTIWVGETELRHRMSWAIGITLHPGKSYMEITGRLVNSTENDNSMLYWSNVSTLVDDNYQIIFPQSTEFVTFHCKNWFAHWPVTREPFNGIDEYADGIDASWWKNHFMSNSMFVHDLKEDFIAGYDHGRKAGTMLAGNHHIVKGGKFWLWGPNSEWDTRILTDNDGHYCELMVGAYSDNQPDYNWSAPYEVKEFTHYWYGLRDIGGVKTGNRQAALNLDLRGPGQSADRRQRHGETVRNDRRAHGRRPDTLHAADGSRTRRPVRGDRRHRQDHRTDRPADHAHRRRRQGAAGLLARGTRPEQTAAGDREASAAPRTDREHRGVLSRRDA